MKSDANVETAKATPISHGNTRVNGMNNRFTNKIKKFLTFKTIYSKIIASFISFALITMFFLNLTVTSTITELEESLIADRLVADINYIEDLISEGNEEANWHIKNDAIYYGDVLIGDGTEEKANFQPFLEHELKTGTLSYVFILDKDAHPKFVHGTETTEGYQEGRYKRVAGSTRNPSGGSIVGTYISKNVSDTLDAKDEFSGEAVVAGGLIFCRYETLKNENNEIIGAIVVGRNINELKSQIGTSVNRITALMFMIVVICCVIIVSILARWISSITVITDYLYSLRNGIMPSEQLRLRSEDEMSLISESINQMVDSLKENTILRKKSETDALTGLPNRFAYDYYAAAIQEDILRNPTSIAFEILDIDYFKEYNDNYGHQAGDLCLQKIAGVIRSVYSNHKDIFCCRYGGDEFVIIYKGFTKKQIEKYVVKLQNQVKECAIEHRFSKVSDVVTVTQGVCFGYSHPDIGIADYFYKADQALYEVKKVSRNSYRIEKM